MDRAKPGTCEASRNPVAQQNIEQGPTRQSTSSGGSVPCPVWPSSGWRWLGNRFPSGMVAGARPARVARLATTHRHPHERYRRTSNTPWAPRSASTITCETNG